MENKNSLNLSLKNRKPVPFTHRHPLGPQLICYLTPASRGGGSLSLRTLYLLGARWQGGTISAHHGPRAFFHQVVKCLSPNCLPGTHLC